MAGKSVLELIAKATISVIVVIVTDAPTLAMAVCNRCLPVTSDGSPSKAVERNDAEYDK